LALQAHAGFLNDCALLPLWGSSAPAGDFPRVDRLWRDVPKLEATLAPGDRVVSIEGESAQGLTSASVTARIYRVLRTAPAVALTFERAGRRFDARIPPLPYPFGWWTTVPFAVSLGVIALLLLMRAREWPLRRRFFVAAALPVGTGLTLWTTFEWTEARHTSGPFRPSTVGSGPRSATPPTWPHDSRR
jgi:hypothetical protein